LRRIFLDEDVERQLEAALPAFEVQCLGKLGLASMKNGELLRWLADQGFDVLIAKDKSIPYQNALRKIGVAVVVIRGRGRIAPRFLARPEELREVLASLPLGEWVEVEAP
jgi:hypothetical protein